MTMHASHGTDGFARTLAAALAPGTVTPFRVPLDEAMAGFGRALDIDVAPDGLERQIGYAIEADGETFQTSQYFISDGDWFAWSSTLDGSRVMTEAEELLAADGDFHEAQRYKSLLRSMQRGKTHSFHHSAFDTPEKLDQYFGNFVRMLKTSARYGVLRRPRAALDADAAHFAVDELRHLWFELSETDTGVAIGADGTLFRIGPGKHRTAAAKLLGLSALPATVRMIHAAFLAPFMARCGGDAMAAVDAAVDEVRQREVARIAAHRQFAWRRANRGLERNLEMAGTLRRRFSFPRAKLPEDVGAALLCHVAAADVAGVLAHGAGGEGPGAFFLGIAGWADDEAPLAPPRAGSADDEAAVTRWNGSAPEHGAAMVLRDVPVPLAVAADGRLLLSGRADARLDVARARDGAVFAEICIVHADWLARMCQSHRLSPVAALVRGLAGLPVRSLSPCPDPLAIQGVLQP